VGETTSLMAMSLTKIRRGAFGVQRIGDGEGGVGKQGLKIVPFAKRRKSSVQYESLRMNKNIDFPIGGGGGDFSSTERLTLSGAGLVDGGESAQKKKGVHVVDLKTVPMKMNTQWKFRC